MSLRSRYRTWWKAITRSDRLSNEIEEELAFHVEAYATDLMQNGISREEAFRRARIELGGVVVQKENMRQAWGTRAWDELRADLRYATRMLAKSPGFTAIAIGSLALGIGANTTVFTLAKQVLLDKLTVYKPEDLRLFSWTSPLKNRAVHRLWGHWEQTPDGKYSCTSFSYPVYQQLRQQNRVFDDVFAFKIFRQLSVTIDNKAYAVTAELVSGNYYSALGVRPVLGRDIQNSDDGAQLSGPVAVISDGFWSRHFGRSPDVIGRKIEVNLTPITIIGINPAGFTGAGSVQISPDIFLPFSMEPIAAPKWAPTLLTNPEEWWVLVMGRVRPGVSDESARAALDVVLNDAVLSTMTIKKDEEVPRFVLRDGSRGDDPSGRNFTKPVYVLMALAGFVLLLACANLANLLLARSSSRQREMSVRLALGAGRSRILRQMFTESLLLSIAGGVAGLILGYFGRNAIPQLMSSSWETSVATIHFDWKIFGFTAAVSIFTGLLFGLAPAWQATRTQVSSGLKDNTQSATQRGRTLAGKTLVVIQVALSMLLLVGAGLFVRTLVNLDKSHLGFRPNNLTLFEIQPARTRYAAPKDIALYRRIEERLSTIPGVDSVTLAKVPLISGGTSNNDFVLDNLPQKSNDDADDNAVGQNYFETMGIPIKAGRGFNQTDTETSRLVAVVDEQLVKKYFTNTNPLGRTFRSMNKDFEIIGVSGDARYPSLREDPAPTFYILYRQQLDGEQSMTYVIHSRTAPAALVPALREAVATVDKDLPLLGIRTQNEQIEDSTKEERIFASLTSGFGILALVLACIGIYGIMAYTVARRTNEIGIRMALGAQAGRVMRMVLREASWMAIAGVLIGLGAAISLARLVASMLFGLKPYDPITLTGAALLLAFVALAASWIPARRAARIDPIQALRHE